MKPRVVTRRSWTVGSRRSTIFLAVLAAAALSAQAAETPRPASPGSERGAGVPHAVSSCPTFSWSTVAGASGYRLAVWHLPDAAPVLAGERSPVLFQELAGNVGSWTPSSRRCLQAGESYGWAVAVVPEGEAPRWSEVALFRIAPAPTSEELRRAIDVIRRQLGGADADAAAASPKGDGEEPPGRKAVAGSSSPSAARPGRRDVAGLTAAMRLDGDLHLQVPDTPRLRLEQEPGPGGAWPQQTWDLVANELAVSLVDDTRGVAPLRIAAGAPDGALRVDSAGVISGDGGGLTNVAAESLDCVGCVDTEDLAARAVNGDKLVGNTVGAAEFAWVYGIMVECNGDCSRGTLAGLCGGTSRAIAVSCTDIQNGSSTYGCGSGGSMTCSYVGTYAGGFLSSYCKDVSGWDAIVYCLPEGIDMTF